MNRYLNQIKHITNRYNNDLFVLWNIYKCIVTYEIDRADFKKVSEVIGTFYGTDPRLVNKTVKPTIDQATGNPIETHILEITIKKLDMNLVSVGNNLNIITVDNKQFYRLESNATASDISFNVKIVQISKIF